MGKGMGLGSREQRMVQDLNDALGASLDLRAVLKDAYPLLLPLVGADYAALAASRSERDVKFEWFVQHLPPAYLASYDEMAPHDFVRSSVLAKMNLVVRDSEMIERRALERNMMYQRARAMGVSLEYVMAVMFLTGGLQSGLSLYRERRRPFTERDQRVLQGLTPVLANTVRNCRLYAKAAWWNAVPEMLLGGKSAVILMRSPVQELDRTALATALLATWFTPVERGGGSLPRVLLERLAKAQSERARGYSGPWRCKREGAEVDLVVEFLPLPGEPSWALELREVPHTPPVPPAWAALLTPAECDVVSKMLRGWDDEEIARDRGSALGTVKKQVQRILTDLGVQDRKRLLYQATREARDRTR